MKQIYRIMSQTTTEESFSKTWRAVKHPTAGHDHTHSPTLLFVPLGAEDRIRPLPETAAAACLSLSSLPGHDHIACSIALNLVHVKSMYFGSVSISM